MSGHSKWAQIKRKKVWRTLKGCQAFTRLGRENHVGGARGAGVIRIPISLCVWRLTKRVRRICRRKTFERAIKRGTGGIERRRSTRRK